MMKGPLIKLHLKKADFSASFLAVLSELQNAAAPILKRSGFSVFLVGGAVRDLVEGRDYNQDCDLVVFDDNGGGARSLANSLADIWDWREPVEFERFGTFFVQGPIGKVELSQAGLRSSIQIDESDPLVSDALSRDFTLNALYIDVKDLDPAYGIEIIDPTGSGLNDIESGLLKTPVHPVETFKDDPVRILRAARFCSTRGYRTHLSIGRTARALTPLLKDVAPERIKEEMDKLLMGSEPSRGLERLARWGVFTAIMPEIDDMVGFRQMTPHHYPDLFKHTMRVVDRCKPDLATRWAALLHDCGKPSTRVENVDVDNYYGHEAAGSRLTHVLLKRLRVSRKLSKEIESLISLHMVHYHNNWTDKAVRRFIIRTREHLPELMDLLHADAGSLRLRADKLKAIEKLRKRVDAMLSNVPLPISPLSGSQIMTILGIEPGPDVGRAKELLAEAVAEGDIGTEEEEARKYLIRKWKEHAGGA